jgi:predicted nucleic acid-binding protein
VSLVYVDTSVMVKRMLEEDESEALDEHLVEVLGSAHELVSSALLELELMRLCVREGLPRDLAAAVLSNVSTMAISRDVLERASSIAEPVRTLDAIHLGTALRLTDEVGGDSALAEIVTYDAQLARAAEALGFVVAQPR